MCTKPLVLFGDAGRTRFSHNSLHSNWRVVLVIYLFRPTFEGIPTYGTFLVHFLEICSLASSFFAAWLDDFLKQNVSWSLLVRAQLKQSGWIGNYALGSSYISLPW